MLLSLLHRNLPMVLQQVHLQKGFEGLFWKSWYLRGTGLGFGWGRLRWEQAAQGDTGQEWGRGQDTKASPVEGQPAHVNTFRLRHQGGPSG